MTLKQQIVTEIMSLVRQQPRKMEPKPTVLDLERILNSESTDAVHIEPDGSVTVTPTVTTVGAVADKVVGLVETETNRLRSALEAVASGSFPNASTLAVAGDWKAMFGEIQKIARAAIEEVEKS